MLHFLNIIPQAYFADFFIVSGTLIVLLVGILGIILYKKFAFISFPVTIVLSAVLIVFEIIALSLPEFVYIITDALYVALVVIALIEFIVKAKKYNKRNFLANYFLKNTAYDYYFSTNKKDQVLDASDSYLDLISLDLKELKKTKGFYTMINEMKIVKINGREVSDEGTLKFLFDYEKCVGQNELYQFDLQVMINNEIVLLKGIVQPIHYNDKFIGRNVYLIEDHSATFTSLRNTIREMLAELENNNKQTYALMSLTKNAIMYFDYKTKTYVATEALNHYLEEAQKEFTIEEFFNMIHPDDLRSCQEQAGSISSILPTRTKLRLYINKKYYDVYDDSLYLNKDSGLVSIISLVNDPEVVSIKHQEEVRNATMWATLEELNPTEVMEDLLNEINVDNTDKKDEADE